MAHFIKHGPLAVVLIVAGVKNLPAEFNLDDALLSRAAERILGEHPKLDRPAIDLLAQLDVAKALEKDLAAKQADADAAVVVAGGKPADSTIYNVAKAEKMKTLEAEIEAARVAAVRSKAHDDAEKEFLAAKGLKRNEDGTLAEIEQLAALGIKAEDVGGIPTVDLDQGTDGTVKASEGTATVPKDPPKDGGSIQ